MNNVKKLFAIILALLMIFAAACGTAKSDNTDDHGEADNETNIEQPDEEELARQEEERAEQERKRIIASIDPGAKINDKTPYCIKVNRLENCVTVYTLGEDYEYSLPVKAMICSAGREGHESPLGDYAINDFRPRWCYMVDGSYGQYCSGWRDGGYLFHSVCYSSKSEDSLMVDEYNMLGSNASLGCIRLQTADAKWIFDNCMTGTPVTIYEDEMPGPLGKPDKLVEFIDESMDNGWDPTDPDEQNPWHEILKQSD